MDELDVVIANEQGSGATPGGTGDSDYSSGVGVGGSGASSGGPGRVVLIMAPP